MKRALVVFKKEFREMMRDKRVRSGAFLMPVIIVLMMIQLFGFLASSLQKSTKEATFHYVKGSEQTQFFAGLKMLEKGGIKLQPVESLDAGKKLLEAGKAKVVFQLPATIDTDLVAKRAKIPVMLDSGREASEIATGQFEKIVSLQNKAILDTVLKGSGLPAESSQAIKVERQDVAKKESLSGSFLVGLLPYLLIIFSFTGAMIVAADLVAGEKERGTLETILVSPVSRRDIALGKFMSLALLAFLSSLVLVATIYVIGIFGNKMLFPDGGNIQMSAILVILVAMLPLVMFFAGMMLALSAFAKNMREAQSFLGIANFIVITPAVFSQLIGFTDVGQSLGIKFVPVLNTAMLLRDALLGKFDSVLFGATLLTNLILASIGFFLAVWMFKREQILARM